MAGCAPYVISLPIVTKITIMLRRYPPLAGNASPLDRILQRRAMLNEIMKEIIKYQKAYELLERLFSEIGAYRDGNISVKTWSEVRDFFFFDDSE